MSWTRGGWIHNQSQIDSVQCTLAALREALSTFTVPESTWNSDFALAALCDHGDLSTVPSGGVYDGTHRDLRICVLTAVLVLAEIGFEIL